MLLQIKITKMMTKNGSGKTNALLNSIQKQDNDAQRLTKKRVDVEREKF